MKSTYIENWFIENEEAFPTLKRFRKYFKHLEGRITEFSVITNEEIERFDFTVENSLEYVKPIYISITYNKEWNEIESYSQKQTK